MRPRLHIVSGTAPAETPVEQVRKRVRAMPKPASMLQCPRCGGRELIESRTGAHRTPKGVSGGAKQHLCALCLIGGERVVVR